MRETAATTCALPITAANPTARHGRWQLHLATSAVDLRRSCNWHAVIKYRHTLKQGRNARLQHELCRYACFVCSGSGQRVCSVTCTAVAALEQVEERQS
jgi:hypothetical protein